MAYTINRRIAELIDANGQLTAGKIAADYITNAHIADNTLTTAQLHTSFVIGSSHIPANTVTINHLAVTDGTANQVLKTDGSGTLSFTTIETNSISQGNTNVTVSDTGTDGKITMTTEGTARWEVTPTGHILPLLDDTYDIGSASKKIRDIYVSTGSIKMGADTVLSINSDGDFEINDASGDPKKIKVDEIEIGTGTDKLILKRGTDGKLESRKKVNGTLQAAEKLFSIASHTTDDITEGSSKLFYTDARTRAAISGTGSLSYNSSTGVMSFTMPAQNTSNITEGSNLYYTDARADARVALIVDSSPAALNTLNELAAALGDDPNFATTVSTSIGTKLPLAGGALTGAVTTNSTFDGRNVSVDGAKLDTIATSANNYTLPFTDNSTNWNTAYSWGNHASAGYLTSFTETLSATSSGTVTGSKYFQAAGSSTSPLGGGGGASLQAYTTGTTAAYMAFHRSGAYAINWGLDTNNAMVLGGWSDSATTPRMIIGTNGLLSTAGQGNLWGASNDGSGSGLDADLLDGQQGSYYLTASNFTGTAPTGSPFLSNFVHLGTSTTTGYATDDGNWGSRLNVSSNVHAKIEVSQEANSMRSAWYAHTGQTGIKFGTTTSHVVDFITAGTVRMSIPSNSGLVTTTGQGTLWGSSNDGPGSGLDADLLDGLQLHAGRNSEANKVVRTDANGYIQSYYINTNIGISEGLSHDLTKVYMSNDDYIRTMGKSDFKIRMGLTKSDYDRMDYSSNTRYHIGSNSHNEITFNQLWARGSGFIDNWNTGAGNPPSGTHFNGFQALHYTDGGSYHHGMQMAMSAGNPALTFLRGHWANGGTGYSWQKIWTDGNDGSGSGLDSDLLDGQHGTYYLDQAASRARTASSYSGNQNFAAAALQFQSSSSGQSAHSYAIFQEAGAWSHPYPDLRIAYHTGIKLGAYTGYGGTRFYSNSDMVTLLFSVGNGDSNVRVTNNIYATQFLYNSDRAYKENIYPLENSLQKVLKLEGVNYTLKSDGTELIGFIAQDVEKIEPKVVDGKEGEKAVNYGQMVALLTEAMKEQQNMIVALQKEVKELKNATK
jgi:hypothetical protein